MSSHAVARYPDHQEKDLTERSASGDSIECTYSDVDDSFTCRTDRTTVRTSNARRVTVSKLDLSWGGSREMLCLYYQGRLQLCLNRLIAYSLALCPYICL
jgi:hypothetical protein